MSTVGLAEEVIRDYIRQQGSRRKRSKRSSSLANRRPLRGAFIIPPPQGAVADSISVNPASLFAFMISLPNARL